MKPPERKKRLKYRVWKKRTNRVTFMGRYEKEFRRSRPRKAGCTYTYKRIDSGDGLIMTYSAKPKRNGCRRSTFRRAKWSRQMICHYCNREIVGKGVDISSTDGSQTLYFCDRICGIACFDADLMHPDLFDKETRRACLERRKERNPEVFELLMEAVRMAEINENT